MRARQLRVELLVMAFLAVAPSLVLSVEGFADPEDVDLDMTVAELLAGVLAALGPAAMAVYLLWRDGRLRAAGFDRRPLGFVAGYGALGWISALIAVTFVSTIYVVLAGEPDPVDDPLELTGRTVVFAIAISLAAGIGEEIVFRAYAISRMEEAGFTPAVAAWAPWALFTVVHLYQGPIALPVIGAVAAVWVWLYRWKRSVWPLVVAHTLYDLTILLLAAAQDAS